MNNSVCDWTVEKLRKRGKARLVDNTEDHRKYLSKPNFVSQTIFGIIFFAIHEIKSVSTLNKPIYVGFSILNLRKLLVYEFHYSYIRVKYGSSAKLLFTDIDGLVYEIKTDDVCEDFYENKRFVWF